MPLWTLTVSACDPMRHPEAANALRALGLHLSTQAHEVCNVRFLDTSLALATQREGQLLERLAAWTDTGSLPLAHMPKCDPCSRRVVGAEACCGVAASRVPWHRPARSWPCPPDSACTPPSDGARCRRPAAMPAHGPAAGSLRPCR